MGYNNYMIQSNNDQLEQTMSLYSNDLMIATFNDHYMNMVNLLRKIEGINLDALLPMYTELMAEYTTRSSTHYHNLEHVVRIMESTVPGSDFKKLSVYLFAMFHDAVYVVGATDNEKKSAELAKKWFDKLDQTPPNSEFKRCVSDIVIQAIELTTYTADFDSADTYPSVRFLLELDLAGLAKPWVDYCVNAAKIREEAREVVPDDSDFRKRRIAFLEDFLQRALFYNGVTDWLAKDNIRRELKWLKAFSENRDNTI